MTLNNSFLFWQPKRDYFQHFSSSVGGNRLLVFLNYVIWVYFFYISFLLVQKDANIFWQLFVATVLAEAIEKFLKIKNYWKRPVHQKNHQLPNGLLKSWYQKGSFPSGHTIKAVYFFLFLIQYQVDTPWLFLSITIPLLLFRLFVGFHYPIDLIGGALIGIIIWLLVAHLVFPAAMVALAAYLFKTIFFIK